MPTFLLRLRIGIVIINAPFDRVEVVELGASSGGERGSAGE